MAVTQEGVLNVFELEPRLKHPTIFKKFDELQEGETLTIYNDHDPIPLYYELKAERGEVFEWEYLEKGPEMWRVAITKKANESTESVLDVTQLEPRFKHPTILKTFDALREGESFVLFNDHDPVPLYYQLVGQRGEIFSWTYLERGPETFRIRIQKNQAQPTTRQEAQHTPAENVIHVTALQPKMKHPTVFVKFDELQPGESLIIHNDHDPKPLYYQMLGERGNIFTWEYLEEGPENWKVRITKKLSGEGEETLGELAVKDLRKAEVFKKWGLDFCCGGKKTVKEACAEKGIDVTKVEQELQLIEKGMAMANTARPLPYNEWSLSFLSDYIVNTHHSYVRKSLPDLRSYANKVARVHGDAHPELAEINQRVEAVCDEMSEHMVSEEELVFPYIKQVDSRSNGTSFGPYETLKTPIDLMEDEHDTVGRHMEKIRSLTQDYTLPGDACASYNFLYNKLQEFENDLFTHIHLENNILFPKALQVESQLSGAKS